MASSIDFTSLSNYWGKDALSQLDFIDRLRVSLLGFQEYFDRQLSIVVQLNQEQEPTQAQWEQAWVAQAGRPLPIPSNAILLWRDTCANTFGGQYVTVNGRAVVYNKEPYYPKGAVIYNNTSYLTSAVTNTNVMLTGNREVMPNLNFTINQNFDLLISFQASMTTSPSAGVPSVDFELNGVKVGTKYFGLPANHGLYHSYYNSTQLFCEVPVYNLLAGTYTVQALYGQAEQLDTILSTFGTTLGFRALTVKAYSR